MGHWPILACLHLDAEVFGTSWSVFDTIYFLSLSIVNHDLGELADQSRKFVLFIFDETHDFIFESLRSILMIEFQPELIWAVRRSFLKNYELQPSFCPYCKFVYLLLIVASLGHQEALDIIDTGLQFLCESQALSILAIYHMDDAVCVNGEDHFLGDLNHLLHLVFTLVHAKFLKGDAIDQDYISRREPEINERNLSFIIFFEA